MLLKLRILFARQLLCIQVILIVVLSYFECNYMKVKSRKYVCDVDPMVKVGLWKGCTLESRSEYIVRK